MERIACGNAELGLGVAPSLTVAGAPWHSPGANTFGGYSVQYRVSSAWSLADSIEALKSNSRYSKWADEISAYTEELEAQGRTTEAAIVRKKAIESAESGKASLSPAKYLPHSMGGE